MFSFTGVGSIPTVLGANGIQYRYKYEFPVDTGAPLPASYTEGNGILTLTQADGQFSIVSGKFTFPAQSSAVFNDLAAVGGGIARTAWDGHFIEANFSTRNLCLPLGLSKQAPLNSDAFLTAAHAFYISGTNGQLTFIENGVQANSSAADTIAAATTYTFIIIPLSTGALYLISGGIYGSFPDCTLLWIGNAATTATVYPYFNNAVGVGTADRLRAYPLTPITATLDQASPVASTVYAAAADVFAEFTWTPGSSEVLDWQFRRTDDNNCQILRCDQAAGNIKLFDKVAGVETQVGSTATQTWTVGTPRRIVVLTGGTKIASYVAGTIKISQTSTANQTATGMKLTGFATGTTLLARARAVTLSPLA